LPAAIRDVGEQALEVGGERVPAGDALGIDQGREQVVDRPVGARVLRVARTVSAPARILTNRMSPKPMRTKMGVPQ
jgi:hypothetical protein